MMLKGIGSQGLQSPPRVAEDVNLSLGSPSPLRVALGHQEPQYTGAASRHRGCISAEPHRTLGSEFRVRKDAEILGREA